MIKTTTIALLGLIILGSLSLNAETHASVGVVVHIQVNDDFTGNGVNGAVVEASNTGNRYKAVTDSTGLAVLNDVLTGVRAGQSQIPKSYILEQNYPNPFSQTTTLDWSIPQSGAVNLRIYNICGQWVRTLAVGVTSAGIHHSAWDGRDEKGSVLPAGMYFAVLESGSRITGIRKMILGLGGSSSGKVRPLSKALNPDEYTITITAPNYQPFSTVESISRDTTFTCRITRNNGPPVPRISVSPLNPVAGDTITFDASKSTDPDGDPFSYIWNGAKGDSVYNVVYDAAGKKQVKLRVQDERGASADTTIYVDVNRIDTPPVIVASVTPTAKVNHPVALKSDGSYDAEGDSIATRWEINNVLYSTAKDTTATFPAAGTQTVKLTLTEIVNGVPGLSSTATYPVNIVANLPPNVSVNYTPASPVAGDTVKFAGNASDPDGIVMNKGWVIDGSNYSGANVNLVFAKGNHTVDFQATDDDGAKSDTSFTIYVGPKPVTARGSVMDLKDRNYEQGAVVTIGSLSATTDANGSFSIAGLQPGTYKMTFSLPGHWTHTKGVTIANADTTFGVDRIVPEDSLLVKYITESVRRKGFTERWDKQPDVYINSERVAPQTKDKIVTYMTNPAILDTLTDSFMHYTQDSLHIVTTTQLPQYGTDGTWLFDQELSGNCYATWRDNKGKINAAYVNLNSAAPNAAVLQETVSSLVNVDDYNGLPSLFNVPTTTDVPVLNTDVPGVRYVYNRDGGTTAEDNEPSAQGLGKAGSSFLPKFDPDKLSPEHRKIFDELCRQSVRPPDYFRVIE